MQFPEQTTELHNTREHIISTSSADVLVRSASVGLNVGNLRIQMDSVRAASFEPEPDEMTDSGISVGDDRLPDWPRDDDSPDLLSEGSRQSSCPIARVTSATPLATSSSSESIELVKDIARYLAMDIVRYLSEAKPPVARSMHARTLRRTVDEVTSRHQILFGGLMKKLKEVDDQRVDAYCASFKRVADEMFSDDQYNWGRIITLYAFAGWMAKSLVEEKLVRPASNEQQSIADVAGSYIANKLSGWIYQQGGWVGADSSLIHMRFFFKQNIYSCHIYHFTVY